MASLKIELREAKLTRDLELFGKQDPYVIIRTPFQEWRSKTEYKAGKFPRWQGQYMFVTEKGLGSDMEIICMEEDRLRSRLIGKTTVSAKEFQQGTGVDKWIEIFWEKGSAGKIRFESTFKATAVPEEIQEKMERANTAMKTTFARMGTAEVGQAFKPHPIKAIILVGGFGTRMRPITSNQPKSGMDFINKPLIVHQIEALMKAGCTEIVLAMTVPGESLMDDKMKEWLVKIGNPNVQISVEQTPMGTAGALKHCKPLIDSPDGCYLFVIHADIICEYPLQLMLDQHKQTRKLVTMLTKEAKEGQDLGNQDLSQYGQVTMDQKGLVTKFTNKPPELESRWINCGAYVMKSHLLDLIEPGRQSMEIDIFPQLVQDEELYSFKLSTWWQRICTPDDFLSAQRKYINRQCELGQELQNDSVVHASAQVAQGAEIGPNVVIGAGCKIAAGTKLVDATILDNTVIERGCLIRHSMIGPKNNIAPFSRLEKTTTAKGARFEEMTLLIECKVGPFRTIGGKGDKEIFL